MGFSHFSPSEKSVRLGPNSGSELLPSRAHPRGELMWTLMGRRWLMMRMGARGGSRVLVGGTCLAVIVLCGGMLQGAVVTLCIIQGGFGRIYDFLLEWVDSAPELDSRPALLPLVAGTSSTTAVACSILVLLVLTHRALCSHDCWQSAEKCTVDALVAHEMHLESCTLFLQASCIFQHVQRSNFWASRFFGALEHSHL